MKSSFDAADRIYARLNPSDLKTAITGGLYRRRPAGSSKEDVVINTLPFTAAQLQDGIVNVNIFVPNLVITVNGVQDNTQPNTSRLQYLTGLAIQRLTDVWESDLNYTVQQQQLIRDEETGEHYSNIRIEFHIENI